MAHLLSSERPLHAAAPFRPLLALATFFANARKRRAERVALRDLLEYDVHRLDDLGINRLDLSEAIDSPTTRPGLKLARARAESARHWLDR